MTSLSSPLASGLFSCSEGARALSLSKGVEMLCFLGLCDRNHGICVLERFVPFLIAQVPCWNSVHAFELSRCGLATSASAARLSVAGDEALTSPPSSILIIGFQSSLQVRLLEPLCATIGACEESMFSCNFNVVSNNN